MNSDAENIKPNILYVDDIKANLMLFEASFDDTYNVFLAESGDKALEVLKEEDIEVLVSDQNMPGMTGNELLERVTVEYPDIMRFMITAYTDYETVVEAINKGHLYGFFNKPYNIEEVKHSIERSIEVRTLRLKNREMIEKLEAANELMIGLDRSKTKFLSSVTDEIRQPINKIMTAIHMIKDKVDSKEISELLQMLDVSVKRLEDFSDQAKQLGLLSNPDHQIKSEQIYLKEIIEIGIIEKANALQHRQVEIALADDAEDLEIEGDFDLVQSLFAGLLGYMIEFSEEGAGISVHLTKKESAVLLEIKTDKPIFPEKELQSLASLEAGREKVIEQDLGMEIVLANEIMHSHGGELRFLPQESSASFYLHF